MENVSEGFGSEVNFVDLRSDEEHHLEWEAYAGVSLGPEADALVEKLLQIGKTTDFISDPGGDFNENGCHIKAREIGATLHKMGGLQLMQAAYYRIIAELGLGVGRSLEFAWGYIGDWLP